MKLPCRGYPQDINKILIIADILICKGVIANL